MKGKQNKSAAHVNTNQSNKSFVFLIAIMVLLCGAIILTMSNVTGNVMQSMASNSIATKTATISSDVIDNEKIDNESSDKNMSDSAKSSLVSKDDSSLSSDDSTDDISIDSGDIAVVSDEELSNVTVDSDKQIYDVDKSTVYHIKAGDTLSQISYETGISVQKLALINDIDNVNLIYANSSLQIPSK